MRTLIPLIAILSYCVVPMVATELRGRVNQYAAVTSIDTCRNIVRITPVAWLQKNDRVMIIQMKGAIVDTSESPGAGTVSSLGSAGLWELCTVDTIINGSIRLTERLLHRYATAHGVQLVKVARARTAEIMGPITGQSWNGTTGGVIAIECIDTLTLHANISARGLGYRGGAVSVNTRDTAVTMWSSRDDAGLGGRKGEGCTATIRSHGAGRSPWANGGGGGNARNGGGGGGGNGGRGGSGGSQPSDLAPANVNGIGGNDLSQNVNARIFFGGGGGGGHQNDFKGSAGAAGGGIVVISTPVLVSDSNVVIDARGNDAMDALEDGAGGGGGGGSIVLYARSIVGRPLCSVDGGAGGENNGSGGCFAPGGGGGGGVVLTSVAVATSIRSGAGGSVHAQECLTDLHHGATNGVDGIVRSLTSIPSSTSSFVPAKIRTPDTTVCARVPVSVTAEGGANYRWTVDDSMQASMGPTITVVPSKRRTRIRCEIMTIDGCVFTDSIRVDTISCADPTSDVGFRIDDVRGAPGDSVVVVIRLSTRDSIRYRTSIRYRLTTRASVLVPLDHALDSTQLDRKWRHTWFTVPTYDGMTDTLLRIPMVLTLGDDERSMMTIDTFVVDDARVMPRLGRFGICSLHVCREGGTRLFDPNEAVAVTRYGPMIHVDGGATASVTAFAFDEIGRQSPRSFVARSPCSFNWTELFEHPTNAVGWILLSVGTQQTILPIQAER